MTWRDDMKVIAYGTAISNSVQYESIARVGIQATAESDSLIMTRQGMSLQRAYNEMLDEASRQADLEALALPHQDLRIADEAFTAKIRAVLRDPEVAMVGALGGRNVRSANWFSTPGLGRMGVLFKDEVFDLGQPPFVGEWEVDTLDGSLLVLSPWAVRNLRFDLRFERDFHFYDLDICFQARALGRRLMVTNLWAVHGPAGHLADRRGSWVRAGLRFEEKWRAWLPRSA